MHSHHNVLSNEAHQAESRKSRGGFTLTELLTTIGIGAVLVALVLPAVQQARDAARSAQETNDIKQTLTALHNFEQTRGRFPAAIARDPETGALRPWTLEVLPYLDQTALYDKWDRKLEPNAQSAEILESRIPVFNRDDNGMETAGQPGIRQPRDLTIMAVAGDLVFNNQLTPSDPVSVQANGRFFPAGSTEGYNGIMPPHRAVRIAEVTGGLSNTAMLIQQTTPNNRDNRPQLNPFNYAVGGVNQNQRTYFRSVFENTGNTVSMAPPPGLPAAIPVDVSAEAGYMQQWVGLSLGVGPFSDPANTMVMAARGQSMHRGVTLVGRGDGSVTKMRPIDAGSSPSDAAGLQLLRDFANKDRGTTAIE